VGGNADAVRSAFETLRGGNLGAVAALLRPDVKWLPPPGVPPEFACRGRDQVIELLTQRQHDGDVGELLELVERGDTVVICERMDHPERFGVIPGDRMYQRLTFEGGALVRIEDFGDREQALG
jgi:ketosteroid isomerase-like protein